MMVPSLSLTAELQIGQQILQAHGEQLFFLMAFYPAIEVRQDVFLQPNILFGSMLKIYSAHRWCRHIFKLESRILRRRTTQARRPHERHFN